MIYLNTFYILAFGVSNLLLRNFEASVNVNLSICCKLIKKMVGETCLIIGILPLKSYFRPLIIISFNNIV